MLWCSTAKLNACLNKWLEDICLRMWGLLTSVKQLYAIFFFLLSFDFERPVHLFMSTNLLLCFYEHEHKEGQEVIYFFFNFVVCSSNVHSFIVYH